jgi:hypothetical protein
MFADTAHQRALVLGVWGRIVRPGRHHVRGLTVACELMKRF